ncbi:MAG: DinB family protein [Pseudomonadota bacterium]
MKAHFTMFARYNAWANVTLYDAAAELPQEAYERDEGAFFGSLQRTLNHILVADVLWMARFRSWPQPKIPLDGMMHEPLAELRAAREAQDADILQWVDGLSQADLDAQITYTTITGPKTMTQVLAPAMSHFFNHQTHHRGQAHMILTRLTGDAPPLDLLFYQRQEAA